VIVGVVVGALSMTVVAGMIYALAKAAIFVVLNALS